MRVPILLLCLAPAFAAGQAPAPAWAGVPGPLVLAGGGEVPDAARRAFLGFAGGKNANLVVVPTASADADDPKQAEGFLEPWRGLHPAPALLHARNRAQADEPEFLKPLSAATAVWFSGGDQTRIMERYRGTLFERTLLAVHRRGGAVGGVSAGAAILSGVMIAGGRSEAELGTGFDFLPGFVVDQHFVARNRAARLFGVLDRRPGLVGLGIDEGTAAIVAGRSVNAVGASTVTILLAAGAERPRLENVLRHGQSADVPQLRRAAANRAAPEPFPPKTPRPPALANGSLVVVGGGGLPSAITDKFFALAGGKDAPLVVFPTAMEDPVPLESDARHFRRLGATNVVVLHTRDRARANDPAFSAPLLAARAVWFGGGRQWRFVEAYEGTLTERRCHEVLARGGVLGGSSAGASILGEYLPRGHPLGNQTMDAEGYEKGFGFLPGAAIDQHFFVRRRTRDMARLLERYPQYLGIGIDEATAVVVTGARAEVVGASKAAFFDRRGPRPDGAADFVEVPAGKSFDLRARKAVASP